LGYKIPNESRISHIEASRFQKQVGKFQSWPGRCRGAQEDSFGDGLGDPGIGNLVGFTCLNRTSQLPLYTEESKGESLLIRARITAGTKTTTNLDS
jgi:hypothetical protein